MNIIAFNQNAQRGAEATLTVVLRLLVEAGITNRTGGFLCVGRTGDSGFSYPLHRKIGEVPNEEKSSRCEQLSKEKVDRLRRSRSDVLSWQSRCDERGEFQGGVRSESDGGDYWYAGFSGLPAEADECFCLIFLIRMRMLTFEAAVERAKISNNTTFFRATVADLLPLTA
ncbi:MAG: hypothetical protein AAB473_03025 [Patescibacteria group bacterium]